MGGGGGHKGVVPIKRNNAFDNNCDSSVEEMNMEGFMSHFVFNNQNTPLRNNSRMSGFGNTKTALRCQPHVTLWMFYSQILPNSVQCRPAQRQVAEGYSFSIHSLQWSRIELNHTERNAKKMQTSLMMTLCSWSDNKTPR